MTRPTFKRPPFVLLALVGLLILTGRAGPTVGQELPPGPTTVHRSSFEVADQPATFDSIQMVLDFAPGAWTPPHFHDGETLVLVLEGEMTVRQDGVETTYRAGEGWRETPRVIHAAGNAAADKARIAATFLLPKGAQLTTVAPAAGAPAPAQVPARGLE